VYRWRCSLTGDLLLGLVDEPTVGDRVPAWPGRVDEECGEVLDPPADGEVIDLDPALSEQLLNVSVGESLPQIPPDGEDDDLGREPEPHEG
jgi:hypothetical protein